MKRAFELTKNTNLLLVAYVVFAVVSKASWPLNWLLNLLAWASLICAYETTRSFKNFFIGLCIAALIESGISTSWLIAYRLDTFMTGLLVTGLLIPALFLGIQALTLVLKRLRLVLIGPLAYVAVFGLLYTALEQIPFGQYPMRSHFVFPELLVALIVPLGVTGGYGLILASMAAIIQNRLAPASKNLRLMHYLLSALWISLAVLLCFKAVQSKKPDQILHVALIQHQMDKTKQSKKEIESRFFRLAVEAGTRTPKPDLVIFPLLTLPLDLSHSQVLPRFLKKLAQRAGTHILIATKTRYSSRPKAPNRSSAPANSAFLIGPDGAIISEYQAVKTTPIHDPHLWLADHYAVMSSPWGPLGVFLCYESTYLRLTAESKAQKAITLIGLQNLLQFKDTSLPSYSLREDRLAAIMSGKPFLRASTGGLSAAITPQGRVDAKTSVGKEEIIFAEVKI